MDALVLSLTAFTDRLLKKAPKDFVFARVLKLRHGREKHSETEWNALLNDLRRQPA